MMNMFAYFPSCCPIHHLWFVLFLYIARCRKTTQPQTSIMHGNFRKHISNNSGFNYMNIFRQTHKLDAFKGETIGYPDNNDTARPVNVRTLLMKLFWKNINFTDWSVKHVLGYSMVIIAPCTLYSSMLAKAFNLSKTFLMQFIGRFIAIFIFI